MKAYSISKAHAYLDPIKWHPEQSLLYHTMIVTARAILIGDRSLICAALLHDLMKPDAGRLHAKAMADMIRKDDDLRYAIHQSGGNNVMVDRLVYHHMDKHVTKRNRDVPYMGAFFAMDDMIHRHDQPRIVCDIVLPNTKVVVKQKVVSFIGQSPVQQVAGLPHCTITINNTPMTYHLDTLVDWVMGTLEGMGFGALLNTIK